MHKDYGASVSYGENEDGIWQIQEVRPSPMGGDLSEQWNFAQDMCAHFNNPNRKKMIELAGKIGIAWGRNLQRIFIETMEKEHD